LQNLNALIAMPEERDVESHRKFPECISPEETPTTSSDTLRQLTSVIPGSLDITGPTNSLWSRPSQIPLHNTIEPENSVEVETDEGWTVAPENFIEETAYDPDLPLEEGSVEDWIVELNENLEFDDPLVPRLALGFASSAIGSEYAVNTRVQAEFQDRIPRNISEETQHQLDQLAILNGDLLAAEPAEDLLQTTQRDLLIESIINEHGREIFESQQSRIYFGANLNDPAMIRDFYDRRGLISRSRHIEPSERSLEEELGRDLDINHRPDQRLVLDRAFQTAYAEEAWDQATQQVSELIGEEGLTPNQRDGLRRTLCSYYRESTPI